MIDETADIPNVLAAIPARAGSKRIKNKNLISVRGTPLIDFTIRFANDLPISKCVLSTDSKQIANRATGKVVAPFLRPKELSSDRATDKDWLTHLLSFVRSENVNPDYILVLRPTSPIRTLPLALEAVNLAIASGVAVRSVSMIPKKMSPYWAISKGDFGFRNFISGGFSARSQDLPSFYFPTGVYDVVHVPSFEQTGKVFGDHFQILEHEFILGNDIDTVEDVAELNKTLSDMNRQS